MMTKMNHIGIVVRNIDDALAILEKAFDAREIMRKEVPEQNQISSIVQLAGGYIELMAPTSSKGAAGKFLEQRGEGLHHISILCDDVQKTATKLETLGLNVIRSDLEPGQPIAFVHPKSLHGILLEITNQDSSKENG